MPRKKARKLVAVKWLDAIGYSSKEIGDVMDTPLKKMLCEKTTYGIIIKQDKDAVAIMTEEGDNDEGDITIIPKPWIIK